MGNLNRGAPIVGAVKYAGSLVEEIDIVVEPYGTDARQGDGDCWDEVVIGETPTGNAGVVIHLEGSHGPAYFQRYPPAVARFQPACNCAVRRLQPGGDRLRLRQHDPLYRLHPVGDRTPPEEQTQDLSTAMLYMSDHGESLGENGVYLHAVVTDEPVVGPSKKPVVRSGLLQAVSAATYSFAGFRRLLHEAAFRQELALAVVTFRLFVAIGAPPSSYGIQAILFLVLMAVEALNTAIEVLVDRISPGFARFAQQAKGPGSFAVLGRLLANGGFVLFVVWQSVMWRLRPDCNDRLCLFADRRSSTDSETGKWV